MNWILDIQKAINFMETNLLNDISVNDVSVHVHSSTDYFQRTFAIITGYSISEYIRNRRLSVAGADVRDSQEKIIDVSLKYHYDTPESFAKAFTRFHGITPTALRVSDENPPIIFAPLTIKFYIKGGFEQSQIRGGFDMSYKIYESKQGTQLIRHEIEYRHAGHLCIIGLDLNEYPGISYNDVRIKIDPLLKPIIPQYGTDITDFCQLSNYTWKGKRLTDVNIGGYFFKANTPVPPGLTHYELPTVNIAHAIYSGEGFIVGDGTMAGDAFQCGDFADALELTRDQILNDNVVLPGGYYSAAIQFTDGEPQNEPYRFGCIVGVGKIEKWDGAIREVTGNTHYNLGKYLHKRIHLAFSADVKIEDAEGELFWMINTGDCPAVGEINMEAKPGIWYGMGGEWDGYVGGADTTLFVTTWGNNVENVKHEVKNFKISVLPIFQTEFYKGLIVGPVPVDFNVATPFRHGLSDSELVAGVSAFRQFLYDFYDKIAVAYADYDDDEISLYMEWLPLFLFSAGTAGKLEFTPPIMLQTTPHISQQSKLQTTMHAKLTIKYADMLTLSKPNCREDMKLGDVSKTDMKAIIKFLTEMGFCIDNYNYRKGPTEMENMEFCISHKTDANIIPGIKLIAEAGLNNEADSFIVMRDFMRGSYSSLENGTPVACILDFNDFVHLLPVDEQEKASALYTLLSYNKCTVHADFCVWRGFLWFSFKIPGRDEWVCEFWFRPQGFFVRMNPVKVTNLDDISKEIPRNMLSYMWSTMGCGKGNGCDCGEEPFKIWYQGGNVHVACLHGDGFSFPIKDDVIFEIIKKWIDMELTG